MSSTDKINDWLQVFGLFGVILSLIFVGFQIRQTHEIALSSVYQSRSNATSEWHMAAAGSPELLSGLSKIYTRNSGELSIIEAVALENYVAATISNFENNHRQYELGFLDEEHWLRNRRNIKCWMEEPVFRELLSGYSFRESFNALLTELANEAVSSPSGCWDDVSAAFRAYL